MNKINYVLLALLLAFSPLLMSAQEDEIKVGVRAGHNAAFGGFAAASLETTQSLLNDFSISGGVQYNTIGRTALEVRPAYTFDINWGRLTPEMLAVYTRLAGVNNYAVGVGARIDSGRTAVKFGYYYRAFGGQGGWIKEPFNIYYELRVGMLEKVEKWDLDLIITNNETFELERHYQPSFIAECFYYPKTNLGLSFGLGCKPAGIFNMSADYYQSYLKTSLCYRW